MAKILILGGGFGGVVAAESLARHLGEEHEITMVSRDRQFIFYPAMVKLAFGNCQREDVSFDLRKTMLRRRVNFIRAEVARIDPDQRKVTIVHGEVPGTISYDYLIYALGRRLAIEQITGSYEHAHHIMTVRDALRFGEAVGQFHEGRVVLGQCAGARLAVPVFETAFAMSRLLEERGERKKARITIVSPEPPGLQFGDNNVAVALRSALETHGIDLMPDFSIEKITFGAAFNNLGQSIKFDLLMLLPPFRGSRAAYYLGVTNNDGYINVDATMRVAGIKSVYAVGDSVNFTGPKMGHMAVQQAEVAAANVAAEIKGDRAIKTYDHEMKLVIDEGGSDSVYVHGPLWAEEPPSVSQGRFWSWAKQAQEKYWLRTHS